MAQGKVGNISRTRSVVPLTDVLGEEEATVREGGEAKLRPGATARHLRNEQVHVVMDNHSVVSDHPQTMGGDNQGPTPGRMLMGALASCTAVHVARHAKRKGYPLESVEVKTDFQLGYERIEGPIHARVFISNVRSRVELVGALTNDQIQELKFVAEHCPVGNTLRRGVQLDEEIVWE